MADVGSGTGSLAFALAQRVGARGRAFGTEIDPTKLAKLRRAVQRKALDNVTIVEAGPTETGLPEGYVTRSFSAASTTTSPSRPRPWCACPERSDRAAVSS